MGIELLCLVAFAPAGRGGGGAATHVFWSPDYGTHTPRRALDICQYRANSCLRHQATATRASPRGSSRFACQGEPQRAPVHLPHCTPCCCPLTRIVHRLALAQTHPRSIYKLNFGMLCFVGGEHPCPSRLVSVMLFNCDDRKLLVLFPDAMLYVGSCGKLPIRKWVRGNESTREVRVQ